MKLLLASDIHGSAYYAKALCEIYEKERPDKLVLLGDLLYHGPRNDLPRDYDTKAVTALLNAHKNDILAVRGNCDAEVDQMVLAFPIMADYATIFDRGRMLFLTHGHLFHEDKLPNFSAGDVLIHGHTHERVLAERGDYVLLNPGSIALPKGDGRHSYAVYEDGTFTTKATDGTVLETLTLSAPTHTKNGAADDGKSQNTAGAT
ncbi:MAG: phosphodiesterase [Ruthenibacterium sp.]